MKRSRFNGSRPQMEMPDQLNRYSSDEEYKKFIFEFISELCGPYPLIIVPANSNDDNKKSSSLVTATSC